MSEFSSQQGIWKQAVRQAFGHKPFIVAIGILLVAAVGMGAVTQFLQLKFRKVPVPLQQELEKIPRQLAHWVQVTEDEPLESDIEHALGTKKYIFRKYVDSRIVGPTKVQEILSKPNLERHRMINEIEQRPGYTKAVIHIGVTYYTGMVDTVAHVPDRCYIADGYAPTAYTEPQWKISDQEQIRVRFINFEDATGFNSRVPKNVAYFFQVNGAMECNPTAVRISLQNLLQANVYYSKIEVMNLLRNRDESAKVMTDFLSQALPEIRKCLPAPGYDKKPAGPEVQS